MGEVLEWLGVVRSFLVYWRPGRQRRLRAFYAPLVGPGDLVFDVGAHLGDRTAAFTALGARVIALEPQPHLIPWLRRLVGRSPAVTVRSEAVGSESGTQRIAISRRTPTVSTLSEGWRGSVARRNPGFRKVEWDRDAPVRVTTLDALIAEYGLPDFCKIDVEGYEAEVLEGLTQPVRALSVEFVAGTLDIVDRCIRRLGCLAEYEFNVVLGEERRFRFASWMDAERMRSWMVAGADGNSSGDLYARRVSEGGN